MMVEQCYCTHTAQASQRQAAVQCCITLQQWDKAVELSDTQDATASIVNAIVQHEAAMADGVPDAIALLKGAGRHVDAARLVLATLQPPHQVRQMHYTGMIITTRQSHQLTPAELRTRYCEAAHIVLESSQEVTGDAGLLSICWRGALASHWLHTSVTALQAGNVDVAVRAGLAASHYAVRSCAAVGDETCPPLSRTRRL